MTTVGERNSLTVLLGFVDQLVELRETLDPLIESFVALLEAATEEMSR